MDIYRCILNIACGAVAYVWFRCVCLNEVDTILRRFIVIKVFLLKLEL